MQISHRLGSALPWLFCLLAVPAGHGGDAVLAQKSVPFVPNSECWDCHEAEFKSRKKGQPKEWVGVRPERFAKSVHAKLNCVDCHNTLTEPEHPSKLPPAQCVSCHKDAAAQFKKSIHGMSHQMGSSDAASCKSCHGTHYMVPVKQADSPVFKFNLTKTCGTCHDDAKLTKEYRMGQTKAAGHYLDSIHGRALVKMGLVVAPTCNDCTGSTTSSAASTRNPTPTMPTSPSPAAPATSASRKPTTRACTGSC